MAKIFPETILKKSLPKDFFDGDLLKKKNLTLKQNAMQALILATSFSKREINSTVAKVADIYQQKIDDLSDEGIPKAKASVIAKSGEKLLKQRIAGLVIFDAVQQIKAENENDFYDWLPSASDTPDPEHALLYGKRFKVGEGDKEGNMPMERYGCNCGMRIIKATKK